MPITGVELAGCGEVKCPLVVLRAPYRPLLFAGLFETELAFQ